LARFLRVGAAPELADAQLDDHVGFPAVFGCVAMSRRPWARLLPRKALGDGPAAG
jgi:hypothetical protein